MVPAGIISTCTLYFHPTPIVLKQHGLACVDTLCCAPSSAPSLDLCVLSTHLTEVAFGKTISTNWLLLSSPVADGPFNSTTDCPLTFRLEKSMRNPKQRKNCRRQYWVKNIHLRRKGSFLYKEILILVDKNDVCLYR